MRSRRGTTEVVIRSSRSTRSGCGSKLGTYVGRASALGTGFPPGGRSPSGGKTISFSAEKETVLHLVRTNSISLHPPCGGYPLHSIRSSSPHKSCAFAGVPGPVYGRLVVENGGLRLYALFGDQPRPLRPCHWGTGKGLWFYPAAAWPCHSRGRVRQAHPTQISPFAAWEAPHQLGPERGTRRRRWVRGADLSLFHKGRP